MWKFVLKLCIIITQPNFLLIGVFMKRQLRSLATLLCLSVLLMSCVSLEKSTQKAEKRYQKLLTKTPVEVTVDMPYIDAYANLKYNYDRCIARRSVIAHTPDTSVLTNLDRENQIGVIDTYIGKLAEIVQVTPNGAQQTTIKLFTTNINRNENGMKKRMMDFSKEKLAKCPFWY